MSIFKPREETSDGLKPTPAEDQVVDSVLPAEVQAASDACISNAEDLVKGAELLLGVSLSNIAYHLAVAALEEIGKSEIIGIMHYSRIRRGDVSERHLDDHVRKLFWALWGPSFGQQVISRPQLEFYRGLATEIHETRMQGLYVEPGESALVHPRDVVPREKAETIVSMARARLELGKLRQPATLDDEQRKILAWFLTITEHSEKRNWLFSMPSMEKLVEVHDVKKWMKWCYDQFQAADSIAREATEREIKRQEPCGEEAAKEKWKMKVRIVSDSHSIRAKELNSWNALSAPIKLFPAGGNHRNELICEITFPAAVPAAGLWWVGWGAFRRFVAALNIGSLGFFWWYMPEHISRFYEQIKDLENNSVLTLERSPKLKIGWGNNVLTSQVLNQVALCFGMLPPHDKPDLHTPFNHYLTGLGYLSKTDVHMQFEAHAFAQMFKAMRLGMSQYGDWPHDKSFRESFEAVLDKTMSGLPDYKTFLKFCELGEGLEENKLPSQSLDLGDVGMMKVLADRYFLWRFDQLARERASIDKREAVKTV
jgi:AbiV family abortive infection protein